METLKKENLYESLPAGLKTECMVRTRVIDDEEVIKQRQELIRSKSPTELSEMRGLEDFPVPTFVENLAKLRSRSTERYNILLGLFAS